MLFYEIRSLNLYLVSGFLEPVTILLNEALYWCKLVMWPFVVQFFFPDFMLSVAISFSNF